MVGVVGHGHGFLEALGFVIDSSRPYRVHITPIAFRLGVHSWVAVDLRGGGNQQACAFGLGQTQAIMYTQRPYFEGLDRNF